MSDFKATPETDLTTTQLLDRYDIRDEATIKSWAKLHGLNGNHDSYSPREVDLLDHVHHHLHNLGMSIDEYQTFLNRRSNRVPNSPPPQSQNTAPMPESSPSQPQPAAPPSQNSTSDEMVDGATSTVDLLMSQYSEAIDFMGERIADHFIDELDASVMRHLAKKVQERQATRANRPNRFLRTIQAVLKPSDKAMLGESQSEDSRLEMESNHRLG